MFTLHNETLNVITHAPPLAFALWLLAVWHAAPPQYHMCVHARIPTAVLRGFDRLMTRFG